mmetsp:Transcript_8162/g.17308  ORF Transcript_8162/g.17308 Transcript_8162/m.17308 type:complete len:322 (-) Transcript_8162:2151-3116(-)
MSVLGLGTRWAMQNDILHAMALNLDSMSRLHYLLLGNTDLEPRYNAQYQEGFLVGPYTIYDGQVVGYAVGPEGPPGHPYYDSNSWNCTQAPINRERTTSLQIWWGGNCPEFEFASIAGVWNNQDTAAGRSCGYGEEWSLNGEPINVEIPFSVEHSVHAVNVYSANWYNENDDGPPPDMFFERFTLVYNNSGALSESVAFPDSYGLNQECGGQGYPESDCYGSLLRVSSGEAYGLYSLGTGTWEDPNPYAPWSHAGDGNMGYLMAVFKPLSVVDGLGAEGPTSTDSPTASPTSTSNGTQHCPGEPFFLGGFLLLLCVQWFVM